jgi:hypothetical protein
MDARARNATEQTEQTTPTGALSPAGLRRREHARALARLDQSLAARRSDQQLYCTVLPTLSAQLIACYSRARPCSFMRVLATLAWHTRDELPYELCDELADFWARVFWHAAAPPHRRFALERMLELGARHRRYPVADQVRRLLWRVRDRGDLALAVQALERSPAAGWYSHPRTFEHGLHERLAATLERCSRHERHVGNRHRF